MKVVKFKEIDECLNDYLDMVEDSNETLVVRRDEKTGVVVLPINTYNSLKATLQLMNSEVVANDA
jgi:PHD/YefM family antitoxin component YafN of YafNO toxin-antitoxin module